MGTRTHWAGCNNLYEAMTAPTVHRHPLPASRVPVVVVVVLALMALAGCSGNDEAGRGGLGACCSVEGCRA